MGRFRNIRTGSVVRVDDSKDDRFGDEWEPVKDKPAKKPTAKPKKK